MDPAELDTFLGTERTARVGTIGPDGPHNTPLWFWWDGSVVWLYSLTRSQRWTDLHRDPRVSVLVDAGHDYLELQGVEILGKVEFVGEAPRTGEPNDELAAIEGKFAHKYFGIDHLPYDGRHAWCKVVPTKVTSWDFRKIPL
jgi:hypothetical protein